MQDVEALLEAYSLQADFFLVQLDNLSTLVDQFQADATYELDQRRNQLFAIQLLITIFTMAFSFVYGPARGACTWAQFSAGAFKSCHAPAANTADRCGYAWQLQQ